MRPAARLGEVGSRYVVLQSGHCRRIGGGRVMGAGVEAYPLILLQSTYYQLPQSLLIQ